VNNLSKQFCIIGIYREALYYEYGQPEVYETAYPGKNPLLSDFPADSLNGHVSIISNNYNKTVLFPSVAIRIGLIKNRL